MSFDHKMDKMTMIAVGHNVLNTLTDIMMEREYDQSVQDDYWLQRCITALYLSAIEIKEISTDRRLEGMIKELKEAQDRVQARLDKIELMED